MISDDVSMSILTSPRAHTEVGNFADGMDRIVPGAFMERYRKGAAPCVRESLRRHADEAEASKRIDERRGPTGRDERTGGAVRR
jgi:hypothetical protein